MNVDVFTEQQVMDMYNVICDRFGDSDSMIFHNNKAFFLTQFLDERDAEQSKNNPRSRYNCNDKYVVHREYMQIESSNNLHELMSKEGLDDIYTNYYDEVNDINEIDVFIGSVFNPTNLMLLN